MFRNLVFLIVFLLATETLGSSGVNMKTCTRKLAEYIQVRCNEKGLVDNVDKLILLACKESMSYEELVSAACPMY
uniref:Saposin B-type domain-containing protein n=1 Tax=Caenorhabditis tropicalis TaxID=1561998 RepID=A0A1I7T6X2_9PELO